MTDFTQFGKQLQLLRKQAGLSQEQLARRLDQLASAGPREEYRVVDGTLVSRWERADVRAGRRWRPTRAYILHLLELFAEQLTAESAQHWVEQAGYRLTPQELARWFPTVGSVASQPSNFPAAQQNETHKKTPAHNLPVSLTSFVGRSEEMALLIELLTRPSTRLVTIVGEGGVGKTRLALATGYALLEMSALSSDDAPFADGVWFVSLVGVEAKDPANLVDPLAFAIAGVFSLPFLQMDLPPSAVLIDFLRSKKLLLILDNFEHLLASAPFLLELLAKAPSVRILVTSRAPLDCQAEQLMVLQGLPVPDVDETDSLRFASVQLFVERARRQDPRIHLDEQTLSAIQQIVALVHGNPLAMELAAHWVRHYSVAELAAALRCAAPTFLSTLQPDVPARHRSMEVIFDTSWRLLSPEAQQVLAELSVFRGAFSRKAALAVTQSSIERLYELVNQSLLHVVEHSSGRKSYMMHELVRQFAATKLAAPDARQPGTAATICRRHSDYYLNFASERVNDLYGRAMRLAAEDMQAEMDNVRAAWEWALQERSAATIASAIAGLQAFYHVRSLYQEGEALFRKAAAILSATDVPSGEIAGAVLELHLARAFFLNLLHRYEDAAAVAHQALLACEGQNLVVLAITAQVERGVALSLQGMHDAALPQLKEAVQAAHSLKLTGLEARALHALFRCLLPAGEIERANSVLMQALNLYHQTENRLSEGFVLRSLGYVAHFQGEEEKALDFWEQALQIYQELGDRPRLLSIWQHLGDAYAALGDLGRAYEYYVTAYARREEVYDPRHAAHTEDGFARLLIRLGRYAQAHELSRQALAEQRRLGDRIGVIETLYTLGVAEREMGDAPAALLHYQEALHLSRTSNAQFYEGAILFEIGNAWAALERPGMALAAYHQALDLTHADGRLHLRIAVKGEMAAVYLAQGHLTEALALIEEALPLLNVSILQKLRDPLRVYWICCQVLQANRVAGADSLLAEAYAYLQMEANSLHDETLRTSLLERVFVNRMIQKAYRSGF